MKHRTSAHLASQKQQSIVYLGYSFAILVLMFMSQEAWLTRLCAVLFGITSMRGIVIFSGVILAEKIVEPLDFMQEDGLLVVAPDKLFRPH